jgi:iron complex outermembrane receptor protein
VSPATRVWLGHADKEFGALGFYGPAPSREWTRQTLASAEHSFTAGSAGAASVVAFARAHSDHFVYDRRRPELSDNRHDSRAAGLALRLHRPAFERRGRLSVGAEGGADWLDSSALGSRGYGRAGAFAEVETRLSGVAARAGLRLDAYGRFGRSASPSLSLAGPLGASLRWRASAGHAWRVPTFTELYYRDPNHEASPDLRPERAWGADLGVDAPLAGAVQAGVTVFARRESEVIDWVREGVTERWHTENIGRATTHGVEASWRVRAGENEVRARYTWLQTHAPGLALQSKYVLDFARHAIGLDGRILLPGGVQAAPALEYRRKVGGRDWWLLDLRVSRSIGAAQAYAEARNLADSAYEEVPGVLMPGRSFALGVALATR